MFLTGSTRSPQGNLAAGAAGLVLLGLLERLVCPRAPGALDRRMRRLAARVPAPARMLLRPHVPLGLPVSYLPIAHALGQWAAARGVQGAAAIPRAAWIAWVAHRLAKAITRRPRPRRPGHAPRLTSFPSGHTTGATALAWSTVVVLRRQGVVSRTAALAIALGVPLLMAACRVVDDEHWATDTAGGMLLGGSMALLATTAVSGSSRTRVPRRRPGAARRVRRA